MIERARQSGQDSGLSGIGRQVPLRVWLAAAIPVAALGVALVVLSAAGHLAPYLAVLLFAVSCICGLLGALSAPGDKSVSAKVTDAASQSELLVAASALAAVLPDPCVLLDANGRVVFQNERARDALGPISAGRPLASFLRAPDMVEAVSRVMASGEAAQLEYVERVPVERRFDAVIAPWPIRSEGEPLSGMVLILHDLTSHDRIERMRADFVANASHELRTPLASLAGFIETLQGPARNDPQARERFLEIMRNQARRMSRLIDDLLSLSRIETNAHLRPDKKVDLKEVGHYVADTLKPIAAEADVELKLSLPDDAVLVRGDRDQLVQVAQNLCENAIKYGASGKMVELAVGLRQGDTERPKAVLSVCDHGPGIAREHLPRLTERFYRVDVASSREKGGTGLGLAIVKHIVNRHRGTLSIESTPGEGACFTVAIEALPKAGG